MKGESTSDCSLKPWALEAQELGSGMVGNAMDLEQRVAETSKGQFRLLETPDRGRCLEAAVDLSAGHRIRDIPVVPHGSSMGRHLAEATTSSEDIKSPDMVAALDFLASMVLSGSDMDLLMSLYQFEESPRPVPMIRRWHKKLRPPVAESMDVRCLEEAWAHVVPNWRQLTVSSPSWRLIEDPSGTHPALCHDTVCGLWLHMALCEHSCDPNCGLLHDGDSLWFTALRPISAGSPITTSYLSVGGLFKPAPQRQKELREVWGFDCACTRCQKEGGNPFAPINCNDLDELLASCSSPPGAQQLSEAAGRPEYCQKLRQLQEKIWQLHGTSSPSPSELALLLLGAIFAPQDSEQDACVRHWDACCQLFEDGPYTDWAQSLLKSPGRCLGDEFAGGDPRDALREAYARHFASRSWRRRRRGTHYVAWTSDLPVARLGEAGENEKCL